MNRRHYPLYILAFTVLTLALCGCERKRTDAPAATRANGPTPNVIFIMIDTLRADRLGTYGNSRNLSPNLDAIAAESVVFERAIAPAPWTQPSIASVFSGMYPGVHRVTNFKQAVRQTVLGDPKVPVFDQSFETMAESLKTRGYATAGIVANPFVLAEFGFAQGFDHFDTTHTGNYVSGATINEAAFEWLTARDQDKPFFLYLHYMDVHGPYQMGGEALKRLLDEVEALPDKHLLTEEEHRNLGYLREVKQAVDDPERHRRLWGYREYWEARYNAGAGEVDRHVGALREKLEALGIWNEALVIVASDHGEQLCERGQWDHGQSVYDTELRVPFMWRWPGQLPAGKRIAQTVELIDVSATLRELLHLPDSPPTQGRSLAAYLTGKAPDGLQIAFAESTRQPPEQKAIHYGPWKLIVFASDGHYELYNLARDPGERDNIAAEDPETAATLLALLEEQLAENARLADGLELEHAAVTPEQLRRLRDLGYLGD